MEIYRAESVYVKNVDENVTEADLYFKFHVVGEVVKVNIPRDFATGQHKGYAFVKYQHESAAMMAIQQLDNTMLNGRLIRVDRVRSPQKNVRRNVQIRMENLPGQVTESALTDAFGQYGRVSQAQVIKDSSTGQSTGVGFITFANSKGSAAAIKAMNKKLFFDQKIKVTEVKENSSHSMAENSVPAQPQFAYVEQPQQFVNAPSGASVLLPQPPSSGLSASNGAQITPNGAQITPNGASAIRRPRPPLRPNTLPILPPRFCRPPLKKSGQSMPTKTTTDCSVPMEPNRSAATGQCNYSSQYQWSMFGPNHTAPAMSRQIGGPVIVPHANRPTVAVLPPSYFPPNSGPPLQPSPLTPAMSYFGDSQSAASFQPGSFQPAPFQPGSFQPASSAASFQPASSAASFQPAPFQPASFQPASSAASFQPASSAASFQPASSASPYYGMSIAMPPQYVMLPPGMSAPVIMHMNGYAAYNPDMTPVTDPNFPQFFGQ